MISSLAVAADLADAVRQQAVRAGTESPEVRGADWQTATVTAVGTDGTVTAAGITARRADTYLTPAIGDLILLTCSSKGNWAAISRLASSTTAGTWQPLPLNTGWTAFGSPYYTPAYRINGDGTASLSGMAKPPASTTGSATLGTLPAGAIPTSKCRFATEVASNVYAVLDVNTSGTVMITDYTGTAGWAALDVASRFRLI